MRTYKDLVGKPLITGGVIGVVVDGLEDYLRVVEFAIWRADHNGLMRTAKVVGWDKQLFGYGGRPKLRAQLAKVDFDQAMTVALLASVSSELSVSEYSSAKAERLEVLAKSFHVDTAAIRKQVAAEVAGKKRGCCLASPPLNRSRNSSVMPTCVVGSVSESLAARRPSHSPRNPDYTSV